MYFENRTNKKGKATYRVVGRFVDPLTGKHRKVSLAFTSDTPRGRAQARRDLQTKIDTIIDKREGLASPEKVKTFGELRAVWFETWETNVKQSTIDRGRVVLNRLAELDMDEMLLEKITPLVIQNLLNDYRKKYGSTFSTMQHIKSMMNIVFDFGVFHEIIMFSPSRPVRLRATPYEKSTSRKRRDQKFLDQRETQTLFSELKKRRNSAYLDMVVFMVATGCRVGEAGALTADDIDFSKKTVSITKSLQTHDLKVNDYFKDTTKTEASERVDQLPDVAILAVKRCITRNKELDRKYNEQQSEVYRTTDVLFRTEYGSPIAQHALYEVLDRVNKSLRKNCEREYGFKWTKHAVPHSFRHTNISLLQDDPNVSLKEVQGRVGHVLSETTAMYTHAMKLDQNNSVTAISRFMGDIY